VFLENTEGFGWAVLLKIFFENVFSGVKMRTIVVTDRDIGVRETIVRAVYFHGIITVCEGYDAIARAVRNLKPAFAFSGDHHGKYTDKVIDMYRVAQVHHPATIRVVVSDTPVETSPSLLFALREGIIGYVLPYPTKERDFGAFMAPLHLDPTPAVMDPPPTRR
jgi:hypothetical protein